MNYIARYLGKMSASKESLLRGGLGSIAVKIANIVLMLLLTVLLARTLGAELFGVYAYALAIIQVLLVPAQFGLPTLVLRETANAHVKDDWASIKGVWRWANIVSIGLSALLVVGAAGCIFLFSSGTFRQSSTVICGLALIPLVSLAVLRGAALRGFRFVVIGQLPDKVLRPGVFVILILIFVSVFPEIEYNATTAMALHVASAGVALLVGVFFVRQKKPEEISRCSGFTYRNHEWIWAVIPLAMATGAQVVNRQADILLLGMFENDQNVGLYKVAIQGSTLVIFGMQAIAMTVAPYFSRLYAQGKLTKLQQLYTYSVRASVLLAIPISVTFIVYGEEILGFVFGATYKAASIALAILAAAQLMNSLTGPTPVLLAVTGHERYLLRSVLFASAATLLSGLILIPEFGMTGAALAILISLTVWNIFLWYYTRTQLGLKVTPFARV